MPGVWGNRLAAAVSELLAVIAAAVEAVSDGNPGRIREIRRMAGEAGFGGGSPWRVLGLYQQMQSRLLR